MQLPQASSSAAPIKTVSAMPMVLCVNRRHGHNSRYRANSSETSAAMRAQSQSRSGW